MESGLSRDVRFLRRYAVVATTIALLATLTAFYRPQQRAHFTEIDVERINVVESDGALRMVISNQARQHPGIVNGKVIPRSGPRPPGFIFFNHLGDEMGGLIFGENGEIGHFGQLTFDKVRGDQTIGFRHLESDDGRYVTGLEMWQQPNTPADELHAKYREIEAMTDTAARRQAIQALRDADQLTTQRLFLGKGRDNTAMLVLSDLKGRPRLRLSVQADGTPAIEVLDETGRATSVPLAR
jgi:hypothetical protein